MRELVTDGVPARIVMAGTSTMKLHERFSKLPARKIIKKVIRPAPRPRPTLASARNVIPYNQIDDDVFSEYGDVMEVDNFGYNRGVSRVGRFSGGRRRGIAGRVHIPISHRLTMPQRSKFVYVNSTNRSQFAVVGRGVGNQPVSGRLNYNRNNRRFHRGGYGNRGTRGRTIQHNSAGFSKNNNNNNNQQGKKSVDQLDRELEEYMRKQKHPRVAV